MTEIKKDVPQAEESSRLSQIERDLAEIRRDIQEIKNAKWNMAGIYGANLVFVLTIFFAVLNR